MSKEIDKDGTILIYNDEGKLHSYNDEPAVVWSDGTKEWYRNGKYHRDNDQPALVLPDGTKYWYQNGKVVDAYYPDFGCFKPKSKEEAMERLDSKPRPYSRELYLKVIDRMFSDG